MADISNTKKYAILWLNSLGRDISTISSELKISKDKVLGIVTESGSVSEETTQAQSQTSKDLMITRTAGKGVNSVAIMTKEASEVGDAKLKNAQKQTYDDLEKGIFRPTK
jgi:hypothetical protein